MTPLDERAIRASIRNCSRGQRQSLHLPDLARVGWEDLDYLGWRDPRAPLRAYLVHETADGPVGLALRAPETVVQRAAQCGLCHTVHSGGIALFTALRTGEAGRRYSTVGTYLCADLACNAHVVAAHRPSRQLPDPRPVVALRREELRSRLAGFVGGVVAA